MFSILHFKLEEQEYLEEGAGKSFKKWKIVLQLGNNNLHICD